MVDNQNQNARYLDKFGSGTSSVRLHAPPGGKSTFSLGWGNDTTTSDPYKKSKNDIGGHINTKSTTNNYSNNYSNNSYSNSNTNNSGSKTFKSTKKTEISNTNTEKSSVRVKHAPGGESSIRFG